MTAKIKRTNPPVVDGLGIEWTARFVHPGGRGKWHIQRTGKPQESVCGREFPAEVRWTLHHPVCCSRCEADTEAYEAAEQYRKAVAAIARAKREEHLEHVRGGHFQVYRCRKCGTQHSVPRYGQGVPFCLSEGHEADLEEVEAIGPAWVAP